MPRIKALFVVALVGPFVAFGAYQMWSLSPQYLAAGVIGIALASLSMMFLPRYADFLLVALLCSIPLASFNKSFFFLTWHHDVAAKSVMRFSGVVSVAVPDVLLAALYFIWAFKIAVLRTERMPHLQIADAFPLLFVVASVLSIPGSPYPTAAAFGTANLVRLLFYYLYLSRMVEIRHFAWIMLAACFAIVPETILGIFQYVTGKLLSLAWARGAASGDINHQYVVPGIENIKRATGTVFDSHSFGIYLAMLSCFPFVMALRRHILTISRAFWGSIFMLAMMANILSFSRSAWLSVAIALAILWAVHLYWGQREVLLPTALFAMLLVVLSPVYAPLIYERIHSAGSKLLTSRFDQFPVAWAMWRDHFLFGAGVGNYYDLLKQYNRPGVLPLPVHNVFLWVGAESGLLGVIAFFGTQFTAMYRCWRVIARHREPVCLLALAVLGALIAYFLDGLTDPLFREPTVYTMFWVCIGLSVAVARIEARLQVESRAARQRGDGSQRRRRASDGGRAVAAS